ncbi:hypothetical protein LCGC14_1359780 [marine sediment metagenome]|uniref:Uncharacterized protein n=1 Tax=marine sediment metagenome TaxID=412755 RepID=A0A0F9KUH5_9ZZZZ
MKLETLKEAQYYKAKTFRALLRFFERRDDADTDDCPGGRDSIIYDVRPGFVVAYPDEDDDSVPVPIISFLIIERTGIWAEYSDENGDWTTEEHLAKHIKIFDDNGKKVF